MLETATVASLTCKAAPQRARCRAVIIWIDWYAYHVARFLGVLATEELCGEVAGIELVGGIGVHAGLAFRENYSAELPITTLMPASSWSDAGQFRLAIKLWKRLSSMQPEAVLIPGYYTFPAIAAALWSKLHRRRSILMTESTAADHRRTWWKETAKSMLVRGLFDRAITGGSAHVDYLQQLGFPRDKIGHFYDVVDNAHLRRRATALRNERHRSSTLPQNYFLYVGRLATEKNVATLISSWIAYREARGRWSLVLVGDGPCNDELRRQAARSSFGGDIHFLGHRGSAELPGFYAHASCFVLPSTREPWGLVVNEAMASGLPVLVSDRCGCADDLVVSRENGFVFDPTDEGQLTSFLLRMEQTTQLDRARMGDRSTQLISRYSPAAFGKQVAELCRETKY